MRRFSVDMMWERGKKQKALQAFLLPTPPSLSFLHGGQHEMSVSSEEAC